MLNFSLILRWFVCLVFSCSLCQGSYRYSRQADSKTNAVITNSSPNLYNNSRQLYSPWSQWTSCSATCGVGFATRTRTCLKSTYNSKGVSIPLCHGDFTDHKICRLGKCPPNSPDLRELQCSQYNNRVVAGRKVTTWAPTSGGPNPCELRCEAKKEKLVYGFGKVSDGTPCPLGVCLDGRCLKVGCDDRLGSEVKLDMCGVCGGQNASCVHYKDVYQGQLSPDGGHRNAYHEVVVIPTGARNLIIRQPIGKNYLALQDRKRGIIFNGEQIISKHGNYYDIAGTSVEFTMLDNLTETLSSKGPITQELYVLVLLRSHNPGIYYEYWLPEPPHNPGRQHYPILQTASTNRPPVTIATPVKSQSYTVPYYNNPKPVADYKPHHRPTKPAYAYGYGEKPYKGQDAPIFRHIATTTPKPRYDYPQKTLYTAQYPNYAAAGVDINKDNKISGKYPYLLADPMPAYKPRYLVVKPDAGYYQTYRNVSNIQVPKLPDINKEYPVLTQGDSSNLNGRNQYQNTFPNAVLDDQKVELSVPKTLKSNIGKRADMPPRTYITNGRLKYSLDNKDADEVYVNSSGSYTTVPLSIAVLKLPDGPRNKSRKGKAKDGSCPPCQRNRDQTKHFCQSDFVIRALVIGFEFLQGETRYELEVKQSFKNTLSLLPKEYVWSPDTCRCPKLRPGKEYLIMGRSDNNYRKRESRLLVDKTCFVRTFNLKYARRLQKLRKEQSKKCLKVS